MIRMRVGSYCREADTKGTGPIGAARAPCRVSGRLAGASLPHTSAKVLSDTLPLTRSGRERARAGAVMASRCAYTGSPWA